VQRLIERSRAPRPWLIRPFSIEGLSGALINKAGHIVELGLADDAQVAALGEELAPKTVGVFVAATL